jgi:AcrR family transcriptional regulator
MSDGVKPATRPGQARTRLARAAVVAAARTLFVERGYAGTTMEAISELADVPPATVYRLFSSKVGILKALLDVSIAGDDRPVAVADRPPVQAAAAVTDPREQLAAYVAITREINTRAAAAYRVLVTAAESEPEAAALLAAITRQRHEGQRNLARSLARRGALRPGVRQRDAEDVVHALMSPEVYRLLVVDRGWSPQRYADWLAGTLADQLLLPASPVRRRGRARTAAPR